ncbi:MAG: hypothetical protein JWO48_769, partial [Bryobacterales bacterium]|nr:hypothetical protein [Bryobacterales bacterium]
MQLPLRILSIISGLVTLSAGLEAQ